MYLGLNYSSWKKRRITHDSNPHATPTSNCTRQSKVVGKRPREYNLVPTEFNCPTVQVLTVGKQITEHPALAGEELYQPPKTDPDNNERNLFATEAADGSIQYYPRKNQATAPRVSDGRYNPDLRQREFIGDSLSTVVL